MLKLPFHPEIMRVNLPNLKSTRLNGNIVALAMIMTTTILLAGIGIGIVVMEGSARAKEMDNAVGAYYMANSGIEQQLFGLRKDDKTRAEIAAVSSSYPGGTSWLSTTGIEQTSSKFISTLSEEELSFVDLFDPDQLSAAYNVQTVSIRWLAGPDCVPAGAPPDLEVGLSEWQFSGGGVTWPAATSNYDIHYLTGGSGSISLDPNKAYRMRLRPFNCSAESVAISFFDFTGNPIDYLGDIVLGSEGTYNGTTQKLTVTMPRQDILSGIFSYILFSEETLCKKVGLAGGCP